MFRFIIVLITIVFLSLATRAEAQMISYTPASGPALGATLRGGLATTFSVSTAGVVTRTAGDAIRLSNAAVTAPTVNFNCGLLNLGHLCLARPVRVTIAPAAGSGPASITRFRISNLRGTTYRLGSAPSDAGVLIFELDPLGLLGGVSFRLGMDVVLAGGSASGNWSYGYTVSVEFI